MIAILFVADMIKPIYYIQHTPYGPLADKTLDPNSFMTFNTDDNITKEMISKWRLVSSGIKIECMNEWDDQEGSWESIRLPYEQTQADQLKEAWQATYTMQDHPTYSSGAIKDLKKKVWQLKPQGDVTF